MAPCTREILIRLTGLCTGLPAEDVDVAAIDDGFFRLHGVHGGPRRRGDPQELRPRRTGENPRLHLAHRAVGDWYGQNPDGVRLEKLKPQPNGINFGPMIPQLPEVLGTSDNKIRLAPQYLLDDRPR